MKTHLAYLACASIMISSPSISMSKDGFINEPNTSVGQGFTNNLMHPAVSRINNKKVSVSGMPISAYYSPTEPAIAALDYVGKILSLNPNNGRNTSMRFSYFEKRSDNGNHVVKLKQKYQGIDVFGAELIVHMDNSGKLLHVYGTHVPESTDQSSKLGIPSPGENPLPAEIKTIHQDSSIALENISITPSIDADLATRIAKENAALRHQATLVDISSDASKLTIFNPSLLDAGENANILTWEINVRGDEHALFDENIFVDAHTGAVVFNLSNIHEALRRSIHDNRNTFGALPGPLARAEGGAVSAVADVNSAYDFLRDTYNFYLNNHGRDSIDGRGMQMTATVRHCFGGCPTRNARWDESLDQMIFGNGYATDDISAHEVTHGITNRESGLVYLNQSGAINESFSDAWGEFVDLTNRSANDNAANRWLLGEEVGAIRNMANPPAFNHPDRTTSSLYRCSTADFGGVHSNSGVNNKAVALLVDGGTFNGQSISSIGLGRTADIYYEAQTNNLTRTSKYFNLMEALSNSCNALIGRGTTTAVCTQVRNATIAVEMDQIPCITQTLTRSGNTVIANMNIGNNTGNADYWVAAAYQGTLYYLNSNRNWTTTATPFAQGGLGNVNSLNIFDNSVIGLPSGAIVDFYFGVDLSQNGAFDAPYRYKQLRVRF